ncbi:MAG: 4-aminobutyrate--2-oxoglutarate transaminase [Desulfacinum sp.]|nr:4-aminobutyrate--2-oxoglutarate transaminase [Desulfacinum sp.]MBZ4660754.1 4-aminobutyrate aminotransferase apoenzyme [Desulfacinum sp.]
METKRTDQLAALRAAVVPQGPFHVTPFFAERAEGARIYDVDGREFIDFAGGIAVMNVGHSHPKVVAAIRDQAEKFTHTCFHVVMYEPYVRLAERLCRLTPGDFPKMALLANSGAEGVENAVKIARYATKRPAVIVFEGGFHGRTLLAMTMTSKVKPYKFGFGPFAPEVYRMPYPYCYRCAFGLTYPGCGVACADHLKDFFLEHVAAEQTAAVVVEPVLGEGGFVVPPPEYFAKLAAICRENGILFVCDEVQTGIGRTGRMFAIEHWGEVPDLLITAKSLAAGMPLSAVVGRAEIMNAPHVGGLGGTYGGNPVACRAALAVLQIFEEENLLERAQALGVKARGLLDEMAREVELVGEVRGLGPMLAMELVTDRERKTPATDQAKAVVRTCYEKGLIVMNCGAYGNVLRLLMPLVTTDEELQRGMSILRDALKSAG